MIPKPEHLGRSYADAFQDESVCSVYRYRPPYPEQAIQMLVSLLPGAPRRVMDAR